MRPFNMYLWPTDGDDFWASGGVSFVGEKFRGINRNFSSRWRFSIVSLKDGRFSTSGCVYDIERGHEHGGRQCVFSTRTAAIRAAAARMLREARQSRKWKNNFDSLTDEALEKLVNWTRAIVAEETGKPKPAPVHILPRPEPVKRTGLPLFDFSKGVAS
jgi:hypothetical protein